jgi:hypothetical protein
VVCLNNLVAKALCTITFAPGTWTTLVGAAADASFAVRSGTKTVMHGTVMIRRGGLVLHMIRGQRPGRYTLVVTIRRGHRTRVLARRTFVVR